MMNRLKKMDKKVDNIIRMMRKVMKGGKYSNGMFRIFLLTKQFARPKIREINEVQEWNCAFIYCLFSWMDQ